MPEVCGKIILVKRYCYRLWPVQYSIFPLWRWRAGAVFYSVTASVVAISLESEDEIIFQDSALTMQAKQNIRYAPHFYKSELNRWHYPSIFVSRYH